MRPPFKKLLQTSALMTGAVALVLSSAGLAAASETQPTVEARSERAGAGEHRNDHAPDDRVIATEDGDDNDDTENNVVDEGDNEHPSGMDRSVESGGSQNQGNAQADPDNDGNGPDRFEPGEPGADQPGEPGGADLEDQDGNNGCGNDDDFEDDNEGLCGRAVETGEQPDDERDPDQGHSPGDDTDDTDEDAHEGDDSDAMILAECVGSEVVVTVSGEFGLSNIYLYNTTEGIRGGGGEDTIASYEGSDLPEGDGLDEDTVEFRVPLQDGTVKVSAKAGQLEDYASCAVEASGDDADDDENVLDDDDDVVDNDNDDDDGGDVLGAGDIPATGGTALGVDQTPGTDVEGDEILRPVTPVIPVALPAVVPANPARPEAVLASAGNQSPRVLGSQVTRSPAALAATGDDTINLVPFGLGLVLLGFGIQRKSKHLGAVRVH